MIEFVSLNAFDIVDGVVSLLSSLQILVDKSIFVDFDVAKVADNVDFADGVNDDDVCLTVTFGFDDGVGLTLALAVDVLDIDVGTVVTTTVVIDVVAAIVGATTAVVVDVVLLVVAIVAAVVLLAIVGVS